MKTTKLTKIDKIIKKQPVRRQKIDYYLVTILLLCLRSNEVTTIDLHCSVIFVFFLFLKKSVRGLRKS